METKLQELTEKIYREGIDKAKEEAKVILEDAQKEADDKLKASQKEAEEIVEQAKKEAEELKKNTLNEMQLSAKQLVSDLRQKVVNLIELKTMKPALNETFSDVEFTGNMILKMVGSWNPKESEVVNLTVLLPEDKQKELEMFFKDKAGDLLNKGLEINFSDKIKGGLKIGPKDGGYLISFTDEDFDNLFRSYMRPKLIDLLYESK